MIEFRKVTSNDMNDIQYVRTIIIVDTEAHTFKWLNLVHKYRHLYPTCNKYTKWHEKNSMKIGEYYI